MKQKLSQKEIIKLESIALEVRRDILEMIVKSNSSHIATSYSVVEIMTILYFSLLRIKPKYPNWSERDRFILSKGHGAAANYAILAERGFFNKNLLKTYAQNGGMLHGHSTAGDAPGIEISTGSLGHGLPIGLGMAIAAKRDKLKHKIYVVLGDGDCEEGSNWEAIMAAGHHKLDNLIVIVDFNRMQGLGYTADIIDPEPFADKWKAFNWEVKEADGHNFTDLYGKLIKTPFIQGKPSVLIAHTVKGKGVSYMENNIAWHYKTPMDDYLVQAKKELKLL